MIWVLVQIPLLLLAFGLPLWLSYKFFPWPIASYLFRQTLGALTAAAGVLLVLLGALRLGRNLTPFPRPRASGVLVTTGMYSLVRHPIYGGILMLAIGSGLRAPTMLVLPLSGVLFAFFDAKATYEERLLAHRFADYPQYKQATAKLIPWVY